MLYFWLFCGFLLATILTESAAESSVSVLEDSSKSSCTKTLSVCTVTVGDDTSMQPPKLIKGESGESGEPGYKGLQGFQGLLGYPGDFGADGLPGPPGPTGPVGLPGFKGIKGDNGLPGVDGTNGMAGLSGIDGDRGPKGPQGDRGRYGYKGKMGNTGFPGVVGLSGTPGLPGQRGKLGPIGPPGLPGKPGICPCDYSNKTTVPRRILFGRQSNPGLVACKASTQELIDGYYYIGPGPIKVKCVTRKNMATLTCIPPKEGAKKSFTYNEKIWLSQLGLNIEDIYGISRTQLKWLQSTSNSAFQTIRYHCLNSNPFPRDNVNASLLMQTWNEKTIGPMPTLAKPYFYSVDPETDGCSKATDKTQWSYTDIKLISEIVQRVPVIDFYIRDVRGEKQSVSIENIELCFD